jgi:O-antigen ligase
MLAVAAVCWGALAFGGAYPWAWWPLAALSLGCGIAGLSARDPRAQPASRLLATALGLVGIAIAAQLVPLPISWLRSLSPATLDVLEKTDFSYGAGLTRFHPLSIDPAATASALALFVSFGVMLVGAARVLNSEQTPRLVEAITIFGVVLALVGIVQKPLYAGKLLGFWEPQVAGSPFGPFINRNHFAGWMLMALPLALALLCGGIEQGMRGIRPGWRYRILWLSSPEANRLILLGAGAMVMALSLVLTMSRSGISALALSLVLTGWFAARNLKGRSRRTAGAAYLVILALTTVAWVGADAIAARFSDADWDEFNNRRGAWIDALGVSAAFRLAGTGLNTYETAARFYQRHHLDHFYGESHNDYLELMAEGGLLLGAPIVLALIALAAAIRRRMRQDSPSTGWWLRRGAVTGLIAIGLQETVEFSLQMPGNAVLFVVLCAIALHCPRAATAGNSGGAGREPAVRRPQLRVVRSNACAGAG